MSDNIYTDLTADVYVVYKTTNTINGKFYIGVHKVNGSNYLGSGKILKLAIKKYSKENFFRETLREFECAEDAYEYESKLVDEKMVQNDNCYNIVEGGGCPPTGFGTDNNFYGRVHSEETKKLLSESRKYKHTGKDHWNYGNSVLSGKEYQCYEMYKEGLSLKQIAKYFSVGYVTVYRILQKDKECKILLESNNPTNNGLTDKQINECVKLCMDGILLNDICKKIGFSRKTISKYLHKNEKCKEKLRENKGRKLNLKLSNKQIKEVIKMKKNGCSLKNIGEYFGVSRQTISKYINTLGGN